MATETINLGKRGGRRGRGGGGVRGKRGDRGGVLQARQILITVRAAGGIYNNATNTFQCFFLSGAFCSILHFKN